MIGRVASVSIQNTGISPAGTAAIHAALSSQRGVPYGPRDTWLILGQSNATINLTDPGTNGNGLMRRDMLTALNGVNGIHYEMATTLGKTPGWGVARYHTQDKRVSNDTLNPYSAANRAFGLELMLHATRRNLATIRYAIGGQPVAYFAPGGAGNAAMLAEIDTAIATAGVPLRIMGGIFINGEKESSPYSANAYRNAMNSLTAELQTRYCEGRPFRSVVRMLPYYTYEHAAGVDEVRAEIAAWVAADTANRVSFLMDDDYTGPPGGGAVLSHTAWWEFWPSVHGGTPQRHAEGLRAAAAIASLGL